VESLPARLKVRNGSQKWRHLQVAHAFLPKTILKRKKRGFAVNVVDDWFRGAVGKKMEEMLMDRDSQIYRYLRPATVQELCREHHSGRSDNHKVLFSLVVFEEFSSYAHVA
jgi:asparagine synthase (glutamine-hydrolysing)